LWIDEKIYEKGLTNIHNKAKSSQPSIEKRLLENGVRKHIDPIIAESAEPKSNRELTDVGFNIIPIRKPKNSILTGISILNRYKVNVTERSLNLKKEINNYKWKWDDEQDKPLNIPIDLWNHLLDAARYWALFYLIGVVNIQNKKRKISKAALGF
jgi:phage terminase large subunit